jgi:hypothetical protein
MVVAATAAGGFLLRLSEVRLSRTTRAVTTWEKPEYEVSYVGRKAHICERPRSPRAENDKKPSCGLPSTLHVTKTHRAHQVTLRSGRGLGPD